MGFEFLSGMPEQSPTRRGAASGKRFVSAPAVSPPPPEGLLREGPATRSSAPPVELPPYRHSSLKVRPGGQVETVAPAVSPLLSRESVVSLPPRTKGKRRLAKRSQAPHHEPTPPTGYGGAAYSSPSGERPIGQTQAKHALSLRRKAKQASVTQRRMRSLLRVVMIASTLIFVVLLSQAAFWRWTVQDTVLHWDGYTQPAAINQVLAPYAKQPLWLVNPLDVESKLAKALPVLASVQVRRHLLPAHIEVVATEHHPWALLFTPQDARPALPSSIGSTSRATMTTSVKPPPPAGNSLALPPAAKPFAVIAETQTVLPLPSAGSADPWFNWQALAQGHPQVPIIVQPATLAALPAKEVTVLLNRLHTVMTSLQAIPRLTVRYVTLETDQAITVYFDKVSVQLGVLESDDLSKAGRLNPLIRTLTDEQLARLHSIDLRWNKNVFWH